MKWILLFLLTILAFSCSKKDCKLVTVIVVDGCSTPAKTTYVVKDKEYCGAELEEVRKLKKEVRVPTGNGFCNITTMVIEK
jgi:hypothetical protein